MLQSLVNRIKGDSHDSCQNEITAPGDQIQSDRPEPDSFCCFAGVFIHESSAGQRMNHIVQRYRLRRQLARKCCEELSPEVA